MAIKMGIQYLKLWMCKIKLKIGFFQLLLRTSPDEADIDSLEQVCISQSIK